MLTGESITEEKQLVFDIDGERYALPAYVVSRVIRCRDLDWVEFSENPTQPADGGVCQIDEVGLPIVLLDVILKVKRQTIAIDKYERALLVVQVEGQAVGLLVDACIGLEEEADLHAIPPVYDEANVFSMAFSQAGLPLGLCLSWMLLSKTILETMESFLKQEPSEPKEPVEKTSFAFNQIFYEQDFPNPLWAMQYMHSIEVTADLAIKSQGMTGYIAFRKGELIAAGIQGLTGKKALFCIIEQPELVCSLQTASSEHASQSLPPTSDLIAELAEYSWHETSQTTVGS